MSGATASTRWTSESPRLFKSKNMPAWSSWLDLYNLFNVNPVLTRAVTVAAGYYAPSTILQANFLKLGARFTF